MHMLDRARHNPKIKFMVNFSADRRHKIEHVWGQRYELHGAEDRERGHVVPVGAAAFTTIPGR